ncbi:hypothetical protein ABW45_22085, partial [Stenotrophomonas maltophilia]
TAASIATPIRIDPVSGPMEVAEFLDIQVQQAAWAVVLIPDRLLRWVQKAQAIEPSSAHQS